MAIHDTVPDSPLETPSPKDKPAFRRAVLAQLARGRDNRRTSAEIARALGMEPKGSNVVIRTAITELLELDDIDVVSSTTGFWIADCLADFDQERETLAKRMRGLTRRDRALQRRRNAMAARLETETGDRLVPEPEGAFNVQGSRFKAGRDTGSLFDEPEPEPKWDPELRRHV